jgi:hypothetical protein
MTIGIFAAGMAIIPSSLDDPMNIFQKIVVVLTLVVGAPGSLAGPFTGRGMDEDRLSFPRE